MLDFIDVAYILYYRVVFTLLCEKQFKYIINIPGTKEAGPPFRGHRLWFGDAELSKRRLFTVKKQNCEQISTCWLTSEQASFFFAESSRVHE